LPRPPPPQYYIAAGVGNVNVKKLAYDLCKAVQLSDLDYDYIASGIKASATHLVASRPAPRHRGHAGPGACSHPGWPRVQLAPGR
jgi:hypothetical protein